jgi:hypothetical protein
VGGLVINLDTLDTVIAIVIVLLVLSLIVQAIQSFIKKLFKIKSGTILTSLEDLFRYVDISSTGKTPKDLVREIAAELKKLGRVSFRGNLMIDSIARDDLLKILEKLGYVSLLDEVRTWFDTVMQSFEERYTRHMKSVAVCVSVVVVVYLNANFFRIYRDFSRASIEQKAKIASAGENLLTTLKEQRAQSEVAANQRSSTATLGTVPQRSASPSAQPPPGSSGGAQEAVTPTPREVKEELEAERRAVAGYLEDYKSLGLSPLTLDQTFNWFYSVWGRTLLRNADGLPVNKANMPIPEDCVQVDMDGNPVLDSNGKARDCERVLRPMTWQEWRASRRQDASGLLGWGVMALLLSVGAPFWQDALESLFGLKNLLRKKSETKNVEEEKGGQPRP